MINELNNIDRPAGVIKQMAEVETGGHSHPEGEDDHSHSGHDKEDHGGDGHSGDHSHDGH